MWYVKVDSSSHASGTPPPLVPLDSALPAPVLSTVQKPLGIGTLGNTCYLSTLVQIIFWVVPLRKRLIEFELSNKDISQLQPIISGELEADSDSLFKGLGHLKSLLMNIQSSMIKKPSKKPPNFKTAMRRFINALGLSPFDNQCVNEFWSQLFDHYFTYVDGNDCYNVQITTIIREVVEPKKAEKARERKATLPQTLLSISQPDLQK